MKLSELDAGQNTFDQIFIQVTIMGNEYSLILLTSDQNIISVSYAKKTTLIFKKVAILAYIHTNIQIIKIC